MDPFRSDPDIHRDHLGSSQKIIHSPSGKEIGKLQTPPLDDTTTEKEDECWPLSDKPFFHFIVTRGNIKQPYQLGIPAKITQLLPQAKVPVILTCRNKSWNMMYYGDCTNKRFNPGWRSFLVDNKLEVGDGCVFELTECSNECIKFRVRILSGEIPSEFKDKVDGMSPVIPVLID